MKKRLIAFASLFLMLLTVFSKPVYAKTLLQESETVSGQEVIGSLKIYDDYTVKVEYAYAVKDIEIIVCKANLCQDSELMRHKDNQDYFDGQYVEINLRNYFQFVEGVEYRVDVTANFKPYSTSMSYNASGMVSTNVTYTVQDDVKDEKGDKILDSLSKTERIIIEYGVPILYFVLGVTIVVKGILLAMDITTNADSPDIRREKIKGFTYFGVAIILLAGLNTFIGFYTGLFG